MPALFSPTTAVMPNDDGCDIWWASPNQIHEDHYSILNETERTRAAHYHHEIDKRRFVAGVVLTRTLGGIDSGQQPAQVSIERACPDCDRPHGKPKLTDSNLQVSVSHSGDWVVCAATRLGPVGVDVEKVQPKNTLPTSLVLSNKERLVYESLPECERIDAFYTYWVRKEAVLKATGDGLRTPMAKVEVSHPREDAVVREIVGQMNQIIALVDIPAPDRHAAAVAIISPKTPAIRQVSANGILAN